VNCERAEELLSARLDRELSPEETGLLAAHLADCPACRRAAEEYPALTAELERAFRDEPLVAIRPRRSRRPVARWLRLAAAALLVAGAALAARNLVGSGRRVPANGDWAESEAVRLPGGTVLFTEPGTVAQLPGRRGNVDEVILLFEGGMEILAAKAEKGRRSVEVLTPVGSVATLGTRFRVRMVGPGEKPEGGTGTMRTKSLTALTAAVMLVTVSQGRVLVRGALGEAVVCAGEQAAVGDDKLVVGKTDRIIKGKVTAVEGDKATVSVGRADGIRKGFKLVCQERGWSGEVVELADHSAVLKVEGEAKVGDMVETNLTAVLAEKTPGPEAPAAASAPVAGLELKLVKKEDVRRFTVVVAAGGEPLRVRPGGQLPEGAKEEEREHKFTYLAAELRNVGEEPIILPLISAGRFGAPTKNLTLFARDGEGKEVPRREMPARWGRNEEEDEKGDTPVNLTVLKPGQVLETVVHTFGLDFPDEGKYTVWVTFEVKPGRAEPLPDVKFWTGKLTSNPLDYEATGGGWGRRGRGRRGRDRRDRDNPAPPAQQTPREVF
jgi:ferric-dicitrate binding protein FerR (iron transport regulator)